MKKKEAYYFSHDANARNDLKCVKLRQSLGLEGYGIFWAIIEILRETDDHKLKISDLEIIAFDLKVSIAIIKQVVNDFDLFKFKGDFLYSKRLTQSMLQYNERKSSLSDAGKRGNAIRWRSGGDGQVIALKERKGKEKKKIGNSSGDEQQPLPGKDMVF
jgi:hypothetical protein